MAILAWHRDALPAGVIQTALAGYKAVHLCYHQEFSYREETNDLTRCPLFSFSRLPRPWQPTDAKANADGEAPCGREYRCAGGSWFSPPDPGCAAGPHPGV